MNIEPNSIIRVLQDVPIDNTYEHTLWFGPRREYQFMKAQTEYFMSKTKYTFAPDTYQRVGRGMIRVGMIADNMYNCNYLMFKNSNFRTESTHYSGDKWFYAFITKVEYINNAVAEITYEIDVMQTWMFDYLIGQCFVERMHQPVDTFGANLVPEEIQPSMYRPYRSVILPSSSENNNKKCLLVISSNDNLEGITGLEQGNSIGGVPIAVWYKMYDASSSAGLADLDEDYNIIKTAGQEQAIVGYYTIPAVFDEADIENHTLHTEDEVITGLGGEFDGYTPRNMKMYTYPYNFIRIKSPNGEYKDYHFEHFADSSAPRFRIIATGLPKASMSVFPINYNNQILTPYTDKLTIENYPEGVFGGDSYQLYMHQGRFLDNQAITASGLSTLGTMAMGDYVGSFIGLRSTISGVMNRIAHTSMAEADADRVYGSMESNAGVYQYTQYGYAFVAEVERPHYAVAKMIDDFFTRYGYAQNQIMTVNVHSRKEFSYVKTGDCTITGSVPADDARKICDIYNAGITFWRNPANVGRYVLDNSPV